MDHPLRPDQEYLLIKLLGSNIMIIHDIKSSHAIKKASENICLLILFLFHLLPFFLLAQGAVYFHFSV